MTAEPEESRPWYSGLLDFVFPPLCLGCGSVVDSGSPICDSCKSAIDTISSPLCLNCSQPVAGEGGCQTCGDESFVLFACGDYVDPLKEIIIQFKFKGIMSAARLLAVELYERFGDRIRGVSAGLLIPIPLHPSREYARGYNQARLFADELGDRLGIPVESEILRRIKKRRPQARLTEARRAMNIRGVFAADVRAQRGEKAILVDDVVTSGATVFEAKRELERAGYAVPAVISIAHKL